MLSDWYKFGDRSHVVWEIPELREELEMFGGGFKGSFQG